MSNPNSVVDFLRQRGRDSSQRARKDLWHLFAPLEPYQFTAAQNQRLLAWLRMGEQTPQIELIRGSQIYDAGNELLVRLAAAGSAQLHTSFDGPRAVEVHPGQTFSVGILPGPGLYPVIVQQDARSSDALIAAAPRADGQLEVAVWEPSREFEVAQLPVEASEDDSNLFERFFDAITEAAMRAAAETAWERFLEPGTVFAAGFDVFIGVTVSLVNAPTGGWFLVKAGAGILVESGYDFFGALIDEVSLADQDKTRLRFLLQAGNLLQIGLRLKKTVTSKRVCEKLVALTSGGNIVVKRFELGPQDDSSARAAGSIFRNAVNRSISLFCQLESAEARRRKVPTP